MENKNSKNLFLNFIFAFLLCSVTVAIAGCNEGQAKARLPEKRHKISGQKNETGTIIKSNQISNNDVQNYAHLFTGTTEAHRRSTIAPTIGGMVKKVHIREGDFVKAGDPIITLNKADMLLQKRQAEAMLASAMANYELSKIEWERSKNLLESGGISGSQFDMVDAKFKAAKAAMDQATVALDMAKKALRDATIRAPFSGLIVKKMVSEGERVNTMPPSALAIIEEIDTLDLRIQVPETEMKLLNAGDEVEVHFDAIDQDVKAFISKIVESIDPRTRSFSVIVEIPNTDHKLRSGMFAEVKLKKTYSQEDKSQ